MVVFSNAPDKDRRAPLKLNFPSTNPRSFRSRTRRYRSTGPPPFAIDEKYLSFHFVPEYRRNGVRLEYDLKVLQPEVSAAAFHQYSAEKRRIVQAADLQLNLTQTGKSGRRAALLAGAAGALAVVVATVIGCYLGFRRDRRFTGERVFYPVAPWKFAVLSLATLGGYSFLWVWRCWAWLKDKKGEDVWPFWRSVFMALWYFPALPPDQTRQRRTVAAGADCRAHGDRIPIGPLPSCGSASASTL